MSAKRRPGPIVVLLTTAAILPAAVCHAAGALYYDVAGTPVGWATPAPVTYGTDQGGLGYLPNSQAESFIADAFGRWQGVPTATISYLNAGDLGVDVDETNYGAFLGPYGGVTTPLGASSIVFDEDGQIFEDLYGVGTRVLGFASPTFFSDGSVVSTLGDDLPAGSRVIEGIAFLNGRMIDGVSGNGEVTLGEFEAVFVHEFGHFSGLDHTQISGLRTSYYPDPDLANGPVETMFPFLVEAFQSTLKWDDVVSLSTLYPSAGFFSGVGCLEGEVRTESGDAVPGANVVATRSTGELPFATESLSAVTGADRVDLAGYRICGLTPGRNYTVRVEEIDIHHSGGSRVGPYSLPRVLPGPPEYYNGPSEDADPLIDDPMDSVVISAAAGQTVTLPAIVLNRQTHAITHYEVPSAYGGPTDLDTGDFDHDADLDLVAVGPATGVTFHRNLGAGVFAAPVSLTPFEPSDTLVVTGHYNSGVDDHLDLAVANYWRGFVKVYWGDGTGGFSTPVDLLSDRPGTAYDVQLASGDFNGDAYEDLLHLIVEADDSVTITTFLGSATGSFSLASSNSTDFGFNSSSSLAVGQLIGSAIDDLLVAEIYYPSPRILWLLEGDGAGGLVPHEVELIDLSSSPSPIFAAGFLDGDGLLDLAMAGGYDPSSVRLLRGLGSGRFRQVAEISTSNAMLESLVIDDFNRDGRADIAAAGNYMSAGEPGARLDVFLGNGRLGVSSAHVVHGLPEFPSLGSRTGLEAADLNGDGFGDLVLSNKSSRFTGVSFYPAILSVLLEQGLPSCVGESVLRLEDRIIVASETFIGCEEIHADPDVEIAAGIEVSFLAGRLVVIGNGFSVGAGSTFTAAAAASAVQTPR